MMNWTFSPSVQQREDLLPVQNTSFKSRENLYIIFFFPPNNFCMKTKLPYKVPMLWLLDLSSHSWSLNSPTKEHILTSHMSCFCPWPTSTTLGKGEETLEIFLQCLTSYAGLTTSSPQQKASHPIQACSWILVGFFLYILMSNPLFLINIMDSVVWYGGMGGVYRPKYCLRIHCLFLSSKMVIREWFSSKETLENYLVQIPPLPKFDVHSIISTKVKYF